MPVTTKATTRKGKKALLQKASKAVENPKHLVLLKSSKSSQLVNDCLNALYQLKMPHSTKFTKRNDIRPFEDTASLSFISQKSDASLFVLGSHSKKRPNQLCFIRMYNHKVLDMYEMGIKSLFHPKVTHPQHMPDSGTRPFLQFIGHWEQHTELSNLKNFFIDFYQGDTTIDQINLNGQHYCLSFTLDHAPSPDATNHNAITQATIKMRCHILHLIKTDLAIPQVHLTPMGPHMDLQLRRVQYPVQQQWQQAIKQPKQEKKHKNVSTTEMGDLTARIHVPSQDLRDMQPSKLKGL